MPVLHAAPRQGKLWAVQDTDPDCRRCRLAFITYEAKTPHGCRAFSIKSARWPHLVVRESTGQPCGGFEAKPQPRNKPPRP